ncbi:MAG TPA: hypothetical protein VKG02_17640 [Blastocatellia bacterium]|nr:hypothetical protein [Blastocatellia bacterium]
MANEDAIRNIVREIVRQALTEFHKAYETDGADEPENSRSPSTYYAPWTGVEYEAHPSRQQFNIKEATVSTSNLLEFVESTLCSIEKNKPCDQCGLCRSLGF